MKLFTAQQVTDIIKLKFGTYVEDGDHPIYTSNKVLGKLYGVSTTKIRQLYQTRFEEIRMKRMPLMQRLQQTQKEVPRQNYGLRFLKSHEINWVTSTYILKKQTALSLGDRVKHFQKEFPTAKMNISLLRDIYRRHKIKKRKIRFYKVPKNNDPLKLQREVTTMK